ncbi:MAG: hypothetical protein FWD73_04250 [Polyangiaceae bacterium]|nr:hypothetical protein [Polyangiaceae bacterium]
MQLPLQNAPPQQTEPARHPAGQVSVHTPLTHVSDDDEHPPPDKHGQPRLPDMQQVLFPSSQ